MANVVCRQTYHHKKDLSKQYVCGKIYIYIYIYLFFFFGGGGFGEDFILLTLLILAYYPTNLMWGSNTSGIGREPEPCVTPTRSLLDRLLKKEMEIYSFSIFQMIYNIGKLRHDSRLITRTILVSHNLF